MAFVVIGSAHSLQLIQRQFLYSSTDDWDHNTIHSEDDDEEEISTHASSQKPQMGSSIGAENVGRMLFNEDILKSGRGDVRIGSMGRWKDFKGNEIVRNEEPNSE